MKTLAEAGFEAAHWSALGLANASDVTIVAFAREHGYVVVTHDLDFSAILAATQGDKPSVVQIRSEDVSPEAIGRTVVDALRRTASQLEESALVSIDPAGARSRLLPLRQQ